VETVDRILVVLVRVLAVDLVLAAVWNQGMLAIIYLFVVQINFCLFFNFFAYIYPVYIMGRFIIVTG